MNYEEQILKLEKRIEVLEKAEHKRIVKRRREIVFKVVKFLVIITLLVWGITYVYSNFIKPYKEKIDNFEEKVNTIEDFVSDKWGIIGDFNPFS